MLSLIGSLYLPLFGKLGFLIYLCANHITLTLRKNEVKDHYFDACSYRYIVRHKLHNRTKSG